MPSIQSVVLTDRATTPVNHTLVPVGRSPTGVATVAKGDGTLIGETKMSISQRRSGGKVKTRVLLAVPTTAVEVINGVNSPKVLRVGYADLTFTFESTHSEQERKNIVGMIQSALDPTKVLVNDTIVKQETVWG